MSILKSNSADVTSFIRDEMTKRGYSVYAAKRDSLGEPAYPTEFIDPYSNSNIYLWEGYYTTKVSIGNTKSVSIRINHSSVLDELEKYWKQGMTPISIENQLKFWKIGKKVLKLSQLK